MAQIEMENIDNNQLFDLVLKEAGGFGRYQKLLLVLSLFVSILAASNHLSPIYLTYTPDYECIEGDPNSILQNITMVNISQNLVLFITCKQPILNSLFYKVEVFVWDQNKQQTTPLIF